MGGHRSSAEGASFEAGAKKGGVWGRVSPFPMRVGKGREGRERGLCPLPRNFFKTVWLKIVHFGVY